MNIEEYLQKKSKYWRVVDEILRKSDLILDILDSRFYEETRNKEIEERIRRYGKKFIFILNKSDLISRKKMLDAVKILNEIAPVIPVTCKERHGKLKLIALITKLIRKRPMIIGVVGYPNTGKSSVINYLSGRKKAKTSPVAGYTRGMQWIKLSKNFKLIDTPGVIPFREKDEAELALKSCLTNIKDPENVACKIIDFLLIIFNRIRVSRSFN